MKCTIKDIARDTGLSLATISKFLNGKKILPENQRLIENSIKKLGYIPNKQAQTLRSKKTDSISILLPAISDYFWGRVCNFIEEYMRNSGFSTLISSYDPKSRDYTDIFQNLMSSQISGVIIIPGAPHISQLSGALQRSKIPSVYLEQINGEFKEDTIASDNFKASYQAAEYLLRHGHRNIGIIGDEDYASFERIRGFRQACTDSRLSDIRIIVSYCKATGDSAKDAFVRMMQGAASPSAIFTLGHHITLTVMQQAEVLDLHIPQDLSLISFDDDEIFRAFCPPITVLARNPRSLGIAASKLLLRRINNDFSGFPELEYISAKFIERDSVIDPTLSSKTGC